MFDFAWSELAVIAAVALVVIGPKDLPVVLRTAGKWMRYARSMASEFQNNLEQMARESELADLRKEVEAAQASVAGHLAAPDLSETILNPAITADPPHDPVEMEPGPSFEAPVVETPVVETSGVETSGVETPLVEAPVTETPPPAPPYVGPMPEGLAVAAAAPGTAIPVALPHPIKAFKPAPEEDRARG